MDTNSKGFRAAKLVAKELKDKNHKVYFVGGCIRDWLLGIEPKDFDLCTSAKLEDIESIFPHNIKVGATFGVIKVLIEIDGEKQAIEVATFRKEGTSFDGGHPDKIEPATVEEDVQRRDFKMNGMLMNPDTLEIIDYVGGQEDIKNKIISCIGDPNIRLKEDSLRILRAIRFVSQLGFKIEDNLLKAITLKQRNLLESVSLERLTDEMTKILTGDYSADALLYMLRTSVNNTIVNNLYSDNYLLRLARLLQISGPIKDKLLAWALLIHVFGYSSIKMMSEFTFSNETRSKIINIADLVSIIGRFDTLGELHTKRRKVNSENFDDALELYKFTYSYYLHDNFIEDKGLYKLETLIKKIKGIKAMGYPEPIVTGNHLIEWGFLDRTIYKEILNFAYDVQLDFVNADLESIKKRIIDHKFSTPRLQNGYFNDNRKKVRLAAECANCKTTMMFTTGASIRVGSMPDLNDLSYFTLELINCSEVSDKFMRCDSCKKKKLKSGFTVLKDG